MCRRLLLACLCCLPWGMAAHAAADASLEHYARVEVETARTSIYVGSVTMHLTPFLRTGAGYHANYAAKVFPYFFWNESGMIAIDVHDEALHALAKGETIQFKGRGLNDDGEERRIEGRVVPTDANSGKIKVRVFVSKRIQLIFNTTYRLGK